MTMKENEFPKMSSTKLVRAFSEILIFGCLYALGFILFPESLFAEDSSVRVGVILPLSGEYAQFGKGIQNAMALEKSEGKKLKLIFEDNRTCAGGDAVTAFKKLSDIDHVTVVVTFCTAAAKAILPLAKAKNVQLIQLTEPGIQNESYMIKMMPQSLGWVEMLADNYVKKYPKMAILANSMEVNTGDYGNVPVFTKRFESKGGKIVLTEEFGDATTDFRSLILKVKGSGAKAVTPFIWSTKQLAAFMTQADELKLWNTVPLAGNFVFEVMYADLLSVYPRLSELDGLLSVNFKDTTSNKFKENYRSQYGEEPNQFVDYGYDVISMLKRCGDDLECLTKPTVGVSGPIAFDTARRRIGECVLKELKHGKFIELRNEIAG